MNETLFNRLGHFVRIFGGFLGDLGSDFNAIGLLRRISGGGNMYKYSRISAITVQILFADVSERQ